MDFQRFAGKSIAILGFGLEGKSTLNFLLQNQVPFKNLSVLDVKSDTENLGEGIDLKTGEHYLDNLDQYDIIFKSSGVPYSQELLPFKEKILTQIQFFFDNYKGKVIAVTASKGKSTISSLIYAMIKDAGYDAKLVGNIGTPIFDEIDFDKEYDFVVCELSSYMLETLKKQNYISILGNIFPEHMDWHGGLDQYIAAKMNILPGSERNIVLQKTAYDFQLFNTYHNILPYGQGGQTTWIDGFFYHDYQQLFPTSERLLLGDHNLQNMCAALAVGLQIGIPAESMYQTIKTFQGLPHRLQFVGEYRGISFYDDAISTTPESTIEALNTLGERVSTLFLGGTDRGYDFQNLAKKIKELGIKNLVFFPPSGERISEFFPEEDGFTVLHTKNMREAIQFAYGQAKSGEICLLSTASPSYSIWQNFEQKGNEFQHRAKESLPPKEE